MSAAAPLPAHRRLDAIDPARAERQSALIDALNNRLAGDLILSASLSVRTDATSWIAFDGLHIAPLLVDGAVPMMTDAAGRPDAAPSAVALGALEPVIAAIEIVVGRPLLPVAVTDAAPDDAVILVVEARANGRPLHRLLLVIPDATAIDPVADLPLDPASIVDVAPSWTATIAAPSLRRERLADMGTGDMLLLGTGRPLARFTPPGRTEAIACRLHVEGGSMSVERTPDEVPHSASGDAAEAVVAITVEFDGGGLTLSRLATLALGSVVPIPATGGTLTVRVRADDRIVASGELVAVGDGYGVLVTGVTTASTGE